MKNKHKKRTIVPVFFAVDDNYAPYLAVAIRSLSDNASRAYDYNIHILIDTLSDTNKSRLTAMQTNNVRIDFVCVADRLDSLEKMLHLREYYTKATYYRFFIPELFPQYKKGIYLDCDMLILGDISELYRYDIKRLLVAAAAEEVMANVPVFGEYAEQVVGIPCDQYFNAGMLVMNLEEMRRFNIKEEFVALCKERAFRVTQDQDYLNVICAGRSLIVNQTWNKTAYSEDKGFMPEIAHFKINYKPWRYDGIMCEKEFWHYAEKTAYYEFLKNEKASYTDAERARDAKMYADLMVLAGDELDSYYNENRSIPAAEICGE